MGKKIPGLMLAIPLLGMALPAAADDDDWRDDGRYEDRYYRDGRYYGDDRYDRDGRYYGRAGAFDEGYTRGYEEGAKEGSKDGKRGNRFELWREGRYRDGDHGYKDRYGSRATYTSGFRRGYEEGYRRGYRSRTSGQYRYDDRVIREYPRY